MVELLLAEANAYTAALGVSSRFELQLQEAPKTALGHSAQVQDELSTAQVRVSEVHDGVSVANYSVDEFVLIARALRDRCSQPLTTAPPPLRHRTSACRAPAPWPSRWFPNACVKAAPPPACRGGNPCACRRRSSCTSPSSSGSWCPTRARPCARRPWRRSPTAC